MAETLSPEQETALLKGAGEALQRAQTADDVRAVWRTYYLQLGHRKLGRLLLGRSPERRSAAGER
jgi:hypothetical protein